MMKKWRIPDEWSKKIKDSLFRKCSFFQQEYMRKRLISDDVR